MTLTPDGKLWIGTTEGGKAQDTTFLGGKVLRLNDDGTVPKDNPFVGKAGYRPEIYTLGHRTAMGLSVHPATGESVGERDGSERRRRDQRDQARAELWLAPRQSRPRLCRTVAGEDE